MPRQLLRSQLEKDHSMIETRHLKSENKCSEFDLILFFILLSKRKALYKQNFLELFSNKDLKTLHQQLNH